MIKISVNGFELTCEESGEGLNIVSCDGSDAVLDLSGQPVAGVARKTFLSCKSLKKVIFPESIVFLGDWAFSKCTNLKSVGFLGNFRSGLFAKGVFDGCSALESISFADFDEDLKVLFSATVNRLSNDILFRSDEVGTGKWYEKWDLSLQSMLRSLDDDNMDFVACGEEDIAYSGMVDGEMPSDNETFVKAAEKNKCFLCFERLLHAAGLDERSRSICEQFITERAFGRRNPSAWITLKEDCRDEVEYYKRYLDIVHPDKNTITDMIADLSQTQVQTKAFLINEAGSDDETDAFFDDLLF